MSIMSSKKGGKGKHAWRTNSLLLVFFPEYRPFLHHSPPTSSTTTTLATSFRRLPLTRALSSISAFALLSFLLLFTLQHPPSSRLYRRWGSYPYHKGGILVVKSPPPYALQGMGLTHRRGALKTPDLVVVHVPDDASKDGLRIFLRTLHRSGLTSRSDVVLVFPHRSSSSDFNRVIREENDAFLRLLGRDLHRGNHTIVQRKASAGNVLSFDAARFVRTSVRDKDAREPLWGKRSNARWSYGLIVSFEVNELDPEGLLSGFLDHVPMSLRRWSCYPMLLGRLRRNFKHVMLVDAKNWVVVNDPFIRILNRSSETVILWTDEGKHHGQGRGEFRDQHPGSPRLNPGVIVGGIRGVRRMAEAMQTGIVRAAMRMQLQQKTGRGRRKGGEASMAAVAESRVLSQLVGKALLPKNVELVVAQGEDDVSATLELASSNNNKGKKLWFLRVGNNSDYGEIRRLICSSSVEEDDMSEIYSDC